jgi:hypothetical protein
MHALLFNIPTRRNALRSAWAENNTNNRPAFLQSWASLVGEGMQPHAMKQPPTATILGNTFIWETRREMTGPPFDMNPDLSWYILFPIYTILSYYYRTHIPKACWLFQALGFISTIQTNTSRLYP